MALGSLLQIHRLIASAVVCATAVATGLPGTARADWMPEPLRLAAEIGTIVAEYGETGEVVLTAALRSARHEPYVFFATSMEPALEPDDWAVHAGAHETGAPPAPETWLDRGDVVIFRHPRQTGCVSRPAAALGLGEACIIYAKRVVGLPGDTIELREGRLHLDGAAVPTELVGDHVTRFDPRRYDLCLTERERDGERLCIKELWIETLPGGRSYPILNANTNLTPLDNTQAFVVPEGHVFVLGDHRDNSMDSRLDMGFVPLENLIGEVSVVITAAPRRVRVLR